tara:strand:+ start:1800 stop:2051 length:252 start_codon:yes stop_codon:yes gene_type:complete
MRAADILTHILGEARDGSGSFPNIPRWAETHPDFVGILDAVFRFAKTNGFMPESTPEPPRPTVAAREMDESEWLSAIQSMTGA